MPGVLAPDPRPVDTDLLHCFSSPWSAAHPVGPMAHGLPGGRGRPGHAGRAGFPDAGVTSPGGRPAAAGHPRRRRRRTGRRRRRQAEPGRAAGSTAPCAPGGHGRQPRPPPTPRREHDKSGNLATPASQPSSLPSCVIRLQPGPVGPLLRGNGTNPGRRGASPEGACRVECRCAAIRHPKVLPGWLGCAVRRSDPAAGPARRPRSGWRGQSCALIGPGERLRGVTAVRVGKASARNRGFIKWDASACCGTGEKGTPFPSTGCRPCGRWC